MGWLSALSKRTRIRTEARLFVTRELPATADDELVLAIVCAVSVAARMTKDAGEPDAMGALVGPKPIGLMDAISLHRMFEEMRQYGRVQTKQMIRVMRQRMGAEAAESFVQNTKADSLGMDLLVLRAAARFDPKCRGHAETAARMLQRASTPELLSWSLDQHQKRDSALYGLGTSPDTPATLGDSARTFVEWYARPGLSDY